MVKNDKIKILGKVNNEDTFECVKFLVDVKDEDDNSVLFTLLYEKIAESTWKVNCTPTLNISKNSMRIYSDLFSMPKDNMPLEKVAGFGLIRIRSLMMEDVMNLNKMMYEISEMVKE